MATTVENTKKLVEEENKEKHNNEKELTGEQIYSKLILGI